MKSLRAFSVGAIGLALAFVGGPPAHAAHQIAPLDDPPISWTPPARVGGTHRRRTFVVGPAARARRRALEPDGDPPLTAHAAPAAVGTLVAFLSDTGRIASPDLHADGASFRTVAAGEVSLERAVLAMPAGVRAEGQERLSAESAGPVVELRGDTGSAALKQCRIEVARRRQVGLRQVDVGTVRLRWIVQPSGEARNVEVVGAVGTDPSVAACVKRVLSMGSFMPQSIEIAVERTYAL